MVKLAVPSFQIAILSNGSIGLHDPVFSPPLRLPIRFSSCMPRWQLLPCTIDLNFHMATSSAHPIFTQSICLWNIIICCNCGSDFELTWCQFQAPEPWLPKRDLDHSRAGSTKELGLGWLRSDVGENIWFIVNMSMIMKGDVVNLLQIVYIYIYGNTNMWSPEDHQRWIETNAAVLKGMWRQRMPCFAPSWSCA